MKGPGFFAPDLESILNQWETFGSSLALPRSRRSDWNLQPSKFSCLHWSLRV
jgi:hypothetical protein